MLAASICREVHFTVLPSAVAAGSRVPRCLFGPPNPRDTVDMLQEALDAERAKFARRWGVNPCAEDKENIGATRKPLHERNERSPRKRHSPYAKQTNIHDFWRARKVCDVSKKSLVDATTQQNPETTKTTTTTTTAAKNPASN